MVEGGDFDKALWLEIVIGSEVSQWEAERLELVSFALLIIMLDGFSFCV